MDNILAMSAFVNSMRRAMVKALKNGVSAAELLEAIAQVQAALNKEPKK